MSEKENVWKYINKDVASYADLAEFLTQDGTQILYAEDDGVLIKDKNGLYVVCADTENGAEKIFSLPDAPKAGGDKWIVAHGEFAKTAVKKYCKTENCTGCYQVAYLKKEPYPIGDKIKLKTATEKELPVILKTYDREKPETLALLVQNGKIHCGYKDNQLVGYIGRHPEGSLGLLYIFPEFRRNGYAEILEGNEINIVLAEGKIPYAHIIEGNYKSFGLQQKLGFTVGEKKTYWMGN